MLNLGPVIAAIIAIATAVGLALGFGGAQASSDGFSGSSSASQVAAKVSKEQALEIALKDAGLTKDQVRVDFGDPEFDVDNVRGKWEIDFELANNPRAEYEYEIDATTGDIIKAEKPRNTQPAPEPTISQERALEIALEHAGLAATDAQVVHIERDREHGVSVWDVDFRSGNYEFDYDINVETGEIVKFEKDFDLF